MKRQPLRVDGRWGWTRQEWDVSPFGLPSSVFDKLPGRLERNPHFVSYATKKEALAALAAAGPVPEGFKPPVGPKPKTPPCVNLKKRFGQRYKITFDPAVEDRRDPWMMQVPCKYGTIYPHGGDLMAIECDYHGGIVSRLLVLGLVHHQCGAREHTLLFHVDDWAKVAEVVQPRRRRQSGRSPEAMAEMRLRKPCTDAAGAP